MTHMAVLIQRVVRQLHFEERERLLHPVAPRCRGVWVHVGPTGGLRFCLSCYLPLLLFPLQRNGGGKDLGLLSAELQDIMSVKHEIHVSLLKNHLWCFLHFVF